MLATRVRRAASSSARRGCWAADTAGTSTVTQSACRDFCVTKAIFEHILIIRYGEYPWHAAILSTLAGDTEYVCGGALVDARHVLTAAHCVKSYYPEELHVRLGDWDVNSDLEPYPHLDLPVRYGTTVKWTYDNILTFCLIKPT